MELFFPTALFSKKNLKKLVTKHQTSVIIISETSESVNFTEKLYCRGWKWKYPVLLNGITSKSPVNAGRLIMVLGALFNLVLFYTTEEETRLCVKWLPLIGYAVIGLAW